MTDTFLNPHGNAPTVVVSVVCTQMTVKHYQHRPHPVIPLAAFNTYLIMTTPVLQSLKLNVFTKSNASEYVLLSRFGLPSGLSRTCPIFSLIAEALGLPHHVDRSVVVLLVALALTNSGIANICLMALITPKNRKNCRAMSSRRSLTECRSKHSSN